MAHDRSLLVQVSIYVAGGSSGAATTPKPLQHLAKGSGRTQASWVLSATVKADILASLEALADAHRGIEGEITRGWVV